MYSIGGASVGLQVGGTATDFVLLVMAPAAVEKMLGGKTKIGSDMTAAAGRRRDLDRFGRRRGHLDLRPGLGAVRRYFTERRFAVAGR